MDEMILHCNANTVYVLNTHNYDSYGEFDMIGLIGSQGSCRVFSALSNATTQLTTALKKKSRASNMLPSNQTNEKLKEVNINLIKKRPHFLKFFDENFFKPGSGVIKDSPEKGFKTQKHKTIPKTSKELYLEAAQMLGMACDYDDDCRCLDCQSRYFDCDGDDDFDTFSNLSAFTETNEFSSRADNNEENLCCCKGEDGFCKYGSDTCENVGEE